MNLIGGYQHHHHLMHEPFPFVQRCHQDAPYFQSWVVNHGEMPPDFQIQTPYPAAEHGAPGTTHDARLEGLRRGWGRGERRGRRRSAGGRRASTQRSPSSGSASQTYIAYLMDVLAKDTGETEGFKAEIKKFENRDLKRKREQPDGLQEALGAEKKAKGRTGWPQQVWALELNQ
ncbi:hypothetical protein F7725_007013 [Dissostichus mawsoni]|uniref:Uncharacterized protein n=1 Tax=Dissostichus mawsoni TaxID=36200 RepID=A0A7J5XW62_DISMA|nr:hypothetical protein F7725_007013 [Dissostichus mawsoni]